MTSSAAEMRTLDSHPALQVPGARNQVRIAAAFADLGGACRGCIRGLAIPTVQPLLHQ